MDNSKIVFLINDSVTAVRAKYEDGNDTKTYTFKSFDSSVEVDDLAIVQSNTRHGYTVVKITEVNVDVDFDSPTELKWLVQKIDLAGFKQMLAQEAEAVSAVQQAELRRKKEELRRTMFKDHEERIASLAIAHHGEEVVTPEQPPSA